MNLNAKGRNGQLIVDDFWVTITRKGLSAKLVQGFSKGEKKIPIQQIIAVQFKKPSLMTAGYIQFTISGGKESTKGIMAAMDDENSVVFGPNDLKDFEKIKNFIEDKISGKYQSQGQVSSTSITEQLKQLAELRDSGILTEAEFKKQKEKLLNS